MRVHRNLEQLPAFRNAVITIGSFDGVHSGHRRIIDQVRRLARSVDGESVLITFYPHPRQIVYPRDTSLKLLTTIEEKIALLRELGIDHLVIVPFTVEFSQLSADEYIEKFLVGRFHPRTIVIGYDHRFGLGRQGDIHYLRWHGPRLGYEVVEIEKQTIDDITVSSTKIRNAIEQCNLISANRLLQHPFLLGGTVVHGEKNGAKIGYPTANLEIRDKYKLIPPDGVYAVYAWHQDQRYQGMLYIGRRPTLPDLNQRTIEVNLFDFNQQIYGDELRLELIEYVRGDRKLDSLQLLSAQLAEDKIQTLAILDEAARTQNQKKKHDNARVAVVLLNYNGRSYLEQFLPILLEDTQYENLEIIVADNGSSDDSLAFLAQHYPEQIRVIELAKNYGFARGYNEALLQVNADYYVLLNSDIEVTEGWLDPIISLLEADRTVAACQPKILSFHHREQFEYAGACGGWIDILGYPFCRGRIFSETETDQGQYENTQDVFWASGAAFVVRAELFHAIGGFDPDYFAHAEEIDLCWRLKRAGYRILVEPASVVYHVGGGTLHYNTPRKTYLNFRNTLFTIAKNEPFIKIWWLIPLRLLLDGLAAFLFLYQRRLDHINAILQAHWDFLPKLGVTMQKRRHYNTLVRSLRKRSSTVNTGRYKGVIIWDYYARGRRTFQDLQKP
ncbi:MAG: bifunctional riboflavin kinase/FAD synthetase [Lewinellaceae bacterium]|nr:bifunctional riboflavin kinase/FAD synthetase [Lewinellaceae bacterium]